MPKGYKLPKSASPRATMKAGRPKKSDLMSQASKISSKVPAMRPTWKRNQKNWAGFKPGSI